MHSLRQKTTGHKLTALQSKYDRSRKSRGQTQSQNKRLSLFPDEERKEKEDDEQYDSTDSLDQLLDEKFTPRHSRPNHHVKKSNNHTPKKNVRMTAGGKRAKAMALMASKNKRNHRKPTVFNDNRHEIDVQNKRQFKSIQSNLSTPAMISRSRDSRSSFDTLKRSRRVLSPTPHPSRTSSPLFPSKDSKPTSSTMSSRDELATPAFSTLKRSRKVITPTPNPSRTESSKSKSSSNVVLMETPKPSLLTSESTDCGDFQETPEKIKSQTNNALNEVGTPLTPTPTKLFKSLNIKTPETELKKNLFAANRGKKTEIHSLHSQFDAENVDTKRTSTLRLRFDREQNAEKNKKERASKPGRRKKKEDRRVIADRVFQSWQDIEVTPQRRKNQAKGSKEGSGSAFDALLQSTGALPLPLKWTILIQKFNALESTLALYQRKSMFFVHYSNITNSVRQIVKKTFVQRDLQEIISIVPDFYHLQWTPYVNKASHKRDMRLTLTAMDYDPFSDQQIEDPFHHQTANDDEENDVVKKGKDQKERMNDIGIRFLKVSKLKEREKVFRIRLVQYLVFHHRQFLIDQDLVEFDPLETGKWHRKFDLENVAEIEISPLPQRERKGADEIEKMIKEQKKKLEEIVQKEMERAKEQKEQKELNNDPMMGKAMVIPDHLSHLSPTMVARIRAKEKGKTIVTTKTLQGAKEKALDDKQYRLQQLPYLVTLLRGIYVSARKSSMSCNDLIALIKKRHRNHHVLSEEIWRQLQILADLKSRFFIVKQGPMVKVAKLNKKIPTKEVLDEIQREIKKC